MLRLSSATTGLPVYLNPFHIVSVVESEDCGAIVLTVIDIDGQGWRVKETPQEIGCREAWRHVFPPPDKK
ncbi:hypothetical protein LAL4801_04186 [Roseibium aggregatum]|uniref:Uncharacterized protein n=1 Tax=Roseibium aggregatum TaxID=187304 RepID=A0A0M6Y9Q0_9HYPH|nr:hypothetical protein LAL4801_04186 [Roseibium aggregatum]